MARFLVMFALVVVACSKDKAPESTAASGSAVAPKPVDPPPPPPPAGSGSAATGSAAPEDPPVVVKPAPKDLPAFGGAGNKKRATELANLALGAQMGANDEDAVAKATAAVKADPSSALARYAIACAAGDEAFDLAQLTPLTTATGCADCVDLIRNLAMGDWHECNWSSGVIALAGKVTPSAQRVAAEALLDSIQKADAKHAEKHFTSPTVELSLACSTCDGNVPPEKTTAAGAKQLAKLVEQSKKANADEANRIVIYGGLACAKDCCAVDVGQLQHNHDFFDKVCFKPGTDQVRSVALISGG